MADLLGEISRLETTTYFRYGDSLGLLTRPLPQIVIRRILLIAMQRFCLHPSYGVELNASRQESALGDNLAFFSLFRRIDCTSHVNRSDLTVFLHGTLTRCRCARHGTRCHSTTRAVVAPLQLADVAVYSGLSNCHPHFHLSINPGSGQFPSCHKRHCP